MPRSIVLITGFGPFPDMPHNASGMLARRLAAAARRQFEDVRFVSSVLPTEWHAAPRRIAALYRSHQPELALHFGVSARVTGFEIEQTAHNACDRLPDAAGRLPVTAHVMPGGSARARSSLPVARILARLAARAIPAVGSHDAGRYLCNAVLYHAICEAEAVPGSRSGFIHVPSRIGDENWIRPIVTRWLLSVERSARERRATQRVATYSRKSWKS